MKSVTKLLPLVLLFVFLPNARAQQPTTAAESADKLRLQLIEVQAKEEALRARAEQLDEALKPENVERSLAGIGSTKPEELRESRRKQLQLERDGVAAQLKVLETSRTRLEAAILDADNRAYHESAGQLPETNQALIAQSSRSSRWLISGGVGFVVGGFAAGLFLRRRLRRIK